MCQLHRNLRIICHRTGLEQTALRSGSVTLQTYNVQQPHISLIIHSLYAAQTGLSFSLAYF